MGATNLLWKDVKKSKVEFRSAALNGIKYRFFLSEPTEVPIVGNVFLIHGWPDLSLGWSNQICNLLSKGLRVVAVDMIGYGGTEAPEDLSYYTLKRASDDIAALASILGVSKIILGGHGWGGAIAYRAALYHPDLVAAFFVLGTPFTAPSATYSDQATSLPTLRYELQLRTDAVADYIGRGAAQNATRVRQILNSAYGVTLANGTSALSPCGGGFTFELLDGVTIDTPLMSNQEMDFYVQEFMGHPFNRTLNWYRSGELNFQDETVFVPGGAAFTAKYSQPALYIGATLDEALRPTLSTGMETYFENLARGEVNGTHWMMWEKPAEVNGYLENWLSASVLGGFTSLTIT